MLLTPDVIYDCTQKTTVFDKVYEINPSHIKMNAIKLNNKSFTVTLYSHSLYITISTTFTTRTEINFR